MSTPPPAPLPASGRELRDLKARAQRLDPILKIGHAGLSDAFFTALDRCLRDHELVKVKFDDFKDRKKELVPELSARTGAQLIQRVGNVAVLFRRRPRTDDAPATRA
ncbi:MAG: YhbY family RNA-binding protein [Verrucomicrobia bacterium]|nr:YhbY family RNA-binding protein [Verrucomicrobiota bacterium]